MEDLIKEIGNQQVNATVYEGGKIDVAIEGAHDVVKSKFPELFQGAEDISKCVANPDKFALTLPARILMSLLASSPRTKHEKDLFKNEQRLIDASEKAAQRAMKANDTLGSYRSKYESLEAKHFSLMGSLSTATTTLESRNLMNEIHISRESMSELKRAIESESRALSTYYGDVDAAEGQLVKLRSTAMSAMYDPMILLFSSIGVELPSSYDSINVYERRAIKDVFQTKILGYLSSLTGIQGGSTTTERAMFPKVSSVFAPSIEMDFNEFKSTEVSRVIQLVYNLALEMEQLRRGSGSEFQRATRVYDLSNDSVIVTSNPLQREVHLLNLITLAGYDPERWAQAFGIPISGIGKQILNAWGGGSKGPLKPEDIRKIFRGDRDRLPYGLDYTSLSYSSRVEELQSISRDVGQPDVTLADEDEIERIDE
uniref:Uncharacterized protein n=1 Tax=viral metagenome TaxID=1070528 RepID=A0A2V0RIC7_9ZZZZ